ncbi:MULTISPECIES: AraC family transcriptional regulator [unclassified Sphingobacterium]|uniref:helix-turn-helix domain-containing protein n=1 Tax=unclassified Sphingobacterium TaxID=2609468 RepID=UPI00104F72F9|nr:MULTISPECIES: hypothetical protein [unclassified Sphingobacterium]MBB2952287.1 hypothetical protein [Sphingobacterium sp. JUb56]MCS3553701.1 hypothetical protein [Sphingobacterium sp. JUb21]TCR01459.1 AraC-like DNA-binding protein [Sphingobacterium sp. JUb20]
MPINFFGDIKPSDSIIGESTRYWRDSNLFFKSECILGAYVFSCKDLEGNQALFNDGLPTLIFMPNKTDIVHIKKADQTIKLNAAWVCCGTIQNTYWQLPQDLEYIIVLRFHPSSFYQIFDVAPEFFLSHPVCSLTDIISEKSKLLIDKLYQNKTVADRMQLLENTMRTYTPAENLPSLLQEALNKIEQKKGNISVADVIHGLGGKINRKWLQRSFVKYMGISPKKYISLQRFIYIYGEWQSNYQKDFMSNSFLSGYYDYNHFLKDFKLYIGVSPTKFK